MLLLKIAMKAKYFREEELPISNTIAVRGSETYQIFCGIQLSYRWYSLWYWKWFWCYKNQYHLLFYCFHFSLKELWEFSAIISFFRDNNAQMKSSLIKSFAILCPSQYYVFRLRQNSMQVFLKIPNDGKMLNFFPDLLLSP